MRTLLSLMIIVMIALVSCENQTNTKQKDAEVKEDVVVLNTYAVVWDILTDDHDYVMNYLTEQAEEFNQLLSKGSIENAYLNNYEFVKLNNDAALATVMFFVKAESVIDAQSIIDQMSFVRNKVATYNVYPVGDKWLTRNDAANVDPTYSFATVWFNTADEATVKKFVEEQTDQVVELWNNGIIENAYFAAENAFEKQTEIPGMVFFVNADTEEAARAICDGLTFSTEGISTYQMFPVGTFWLGSAE